MAFQSPRIHGVVGVEAEFQRIDHRHDGGPPVARVKLHLTTARDREHGLILENSTVEIFFPDGTQDYAARIAEAVNNTQRVEAEQSAD